tara:strand:- start:780 stop:1778 length:999 start_codon:yes stop_codon:yes gene_type:complete
MKKRLLPFIIAFSALSVSASAAFYSVFGLSHLFAGASTEVIIMAGALEFAKLVVASLLYQYWNVINKWLRAYLISAVFILMVITSGGIYGFLSGAFAETNTQSQFLDKQVAIIDAKRIRFIENRDDLKLTIKDLTTSLANPTMIQYVDSASGQLVTTTSSRTRKMLQNQLTEAKTNLTAVTDSIAILDVKILDTQINNESARELGPLKYMAELTGKPMEQIVNWFMLLIIFVFDPLAIAMVVAANMAFAQIKGFKPKEEKKEYKVYKKPEASKEKVIIKKVPVEKIIEVEKIVKEPKSKIPKHLKGIIENALKNARRNGKDTSKFDHGLFED